VLRIEKLAIRSSMYLSYQSCKHCSMTMNIAKAFLETPRNCSSDGTIDYCIGSVVVLSAPNGTLCFGKIVDFVFSREADCFFGVEVYESFFFLFLRNSTCLNF